MQQGCHSTIGMEPTKELVGGGRRFLNGRMGVFKGSNNCYCHVCQCNSSIIAVVVVQAGAGGLKKKLQSNSSENKAG